MADRFLIAPINSGLIQGVPSWTLPEDAFQEIENAHVDKGVIKKRFGSNITGNSALTSRTRVALTGGAAVGETDASGDATSTIPTAPYDNIGMLFSIGDQLFTVKEAGTPANLLHNTSATTATYDSSNGTYVFTGATASTQIYWYPALPIMGITQYEKGSVNTHTTYVMDTRYVYKFSGVNWIKDTSFGFTFKGTNKQFFSCANYLGVTNDVIGLFISNFNAVKTGAADDDPMYYYNGATWADFTQLTEIVAVANVATERVSSAKIILSWKNRLLLLNCIEQDIAGSTNKHYQSRIRYSANGSPVTPTVAATTTYNHPWLERRQTYQEVVGVFTGTFVSCGGGYIDLPVEEEIVSAAIVRDHLIIYAERSTWELSYTGNQVTPFVFRNIDSSVGSECSYSTVVTDNKALTIGTTGINSCDGLTVRRIDQKIPYFASSLLKTEDGISRVHGIRDYYKKFVYWTVLQNSVSDVCEYPDKVIAYNYDNGTWSFYDDTITSFGYFEQAKDYDWTYASDWKIDDSWGSFYQQTNSRLILAGNHQGFLFTLNDSPSNAGVMTLANVANGLCTVTDHNLKSDDFVYLEDDVLGSDVYKVTRVTSDTFYLQDVNNNYPVGAYVGGGTLSLVSRVKILSAEWNPYIKNGNDVYLSRVDFCVKNNPAAEMIINYTSDTATLDLVDQGLISNSILGTSILEMHRYTTEPLYVNYKKILWRTVYLQSSGSSMSIFMTYSDSHMFDRNISQSPFEIQAIMLYTDKVGR